METSLLILGEEATKAPSNFTPEVFHKLLTNAFGPAASKIAQRYPVFEFSNTPYPAFSALVKASTDFIFLCSTYQGISTAAQKRVPEWTYLWGQTPPCPWYPKISADALPIFGASHTSEIAYVFANTDNQPLPGGHCNFTTAERTLSSQIADFWTSMAANGNPGEDWPRFTISGSEGLNVLNGSHTAMPGVIDYSVCELWNEFYD